MISHMIADILCATCKATDRGLFIEKAHAVAFLAHKQKVPDDVRTVGVAVHMPTNGPTFRHCRLCSSAAHEKRTLYMCLACNVPLCAAPCFRKFHDK